ncbi:hypothetical protein JCM1840_006045 [Sporobolomyces johnsonii]
MLSQNPTPEELAPDGLLNDQQCFDFDGRLTQLRLEEQLNTMMARMESLAASNASLASDNASLRDRIAHQPSTSPTNSASPFPTTLPQEINWKELFAAVKEEFHGPPPPASGSKIKVKEPTPFDGACSSKTDVNIFAAQITNYVAETAGWRDDAHKVRVCASYLSGPAYNWISSYLVLTTEEKDKPEYDWLRNFELFKNKLVSTFGDPDKEAADARRLTSLRQTGAASLYAAEFRRLALNLGWNTKPLKYHFIEGLKDHLQDELARLDPIDDFDALVDRVVLLDNRAYQRRLRKAGRSVFSFGPALRTTSAPEIAADDRMQIDANRKAPIPRRGPLTQSEKDYRLKNNLCSYCGGAGHFADGCPALASRDKNRAPRNRPLRTAAVTFQILSPHEGDNATIINDKGEAGNGPRPVENQD